MNRRQGEDSEPDHRQDQPVPLVQLTDRDPDGGGVIQAYGPEGFRIDGQWHPAPCLVRPGGFTLWQPEDPVSIGSLAWLLPDSEPPELILFGGGQSSLMLPDALRAALREQAIGFETMNTGAACRTFQMLHAERRQVAAALLPAGFRPPV